MENDKIKNIQEKDSSRKGDGLQIWTEAVIAQKINGFQSEIHAVVYNWYFQLIQQPLAGRWFSGFLSLLL